MPKINDEIIFIAGAIFDTAIKRRVTTYTLKELMAMAGLSENDFKLNSGLEIDQGYGDGYRSAQLYDVALSKEQFFGDGDVELVQIRTRKTRQVTQYYDEITYASLQTTNEAGKAEPGGEASEASLPAVEPTVRAAEQSKCHQTASTFL